MDGWDENKLCITHFKTNSRWTTHFEIPCTLTQEIHITQVLAHNQNNNGKWVYREWKIPVLSQADTSYYWVHKIQLITKHHVLLLGFTITTQKPTEICQVSCKNQSHLSMCKRWHKHLSTCKRWHKQPCTCKQWHKQSSACKRWHRRTNQVVTCVTNQTLPRVAHPPPNSYK